LKRLTYLLFGLLVLSSCEQDAFYEVPDGHTKLFAFSEITTDCKIKVEVNTAVGINTEDGFTFPKQSDAQVVLLKDGIELADPGFRYISREKAFVSQGDFTPEAGVEYSLKVFLKNETDIEPIYGTTIIPEPEVLEDVFLRSFSEQQVSPSQKDFAANFDVGFDGMEAPYYILKPYFINQEGDKEALIVSDITSGRDAVQYTKFMNGVLVDMMELDGRLGLELMNAQHVNVNSKISEVYLELHTITNEGFKYYKSFNRQVDAQTAAVSEPVISYTNFDKGLGLFTGYSSSIKTIEIK